ncbi:MAG: alkyl hydroperoxide reductase [Bacillales bacterium]|jgi:peroxiredoxin|nr:alkyl hydroperoxide reductase [Bacillales bacterium]
MFDWKKGIVIVLILGLVTYGAWETYKTYSNQKDGTINEQVNTSNIGLERGNIAPDFELQTLTGQSVKLSDLRGKKVILNFWATWCGPCKVEMPEIQKFYEKVGNDVTILAISVAENPSVVTNFINNTNYTFPILLDPAPVASNTYKIISIPTTYFIDSKGVISDTIVGTTTYDMLKIKYSKLD